MLSLQLLLSKQYQTACALSTYDLFFSFRNFFQLQRGGAGARPPPLKYALGDCPFRSLRRDNEMYVELEAHKSVLRTPSSPRLAIIEACVWVSCAAVRCLAVGSDCREARKRYARAKAYIRA